MVTMYEAKVNSPATQLASSINSTDTVLSLNTTGVLPDPPNLLTIGVGEDAETCRYTNIDGNTVTVEREFEGVAKEWDAGEPVARNFTSYDHNAFVAAVDEMSKVVETDEKTSDYTLTLSDIRKVVLMNKTGDANVTVPKNDTVDFPIGTIINIYNISEDLVTVEGAVDVTVRNEGSFGQYREVSLRKRDGNEWVLVGDVE